MEMSGQLHAPLIYSEERAPSTHWIGGCVGPRAGLDAVMKKKIPSPAENRTLEPQSSSAIPTELSRILNETYLICQNQLIIK
jgi:hypothetical protein